MITKHEQLSEIQEPMCKKVKDESGGDMETCYKLLASLYNRMRGRGNTLDLSTDIFERIMTGCGMVIFDVSEEQADAAMKKTR